LKFNLNFNPGSFNFNPNFNFNYNFMTVFSSFFGNVTYTIHTRPDEFRDAKQVILGLFDFEGPRKRPCADCMPVEMELLVIGPNLPLGGRLVTIALLFIDHIWTDFETAEVWTRGALWKLTRSEERLPRTYKETH
jgi:hypothetical protein